MKKALLFTVALLAIPHLAGCQVQEVAEEPGQDCPQIVGEPDEFIEAIGGDGADINAETRCQNVTVTLRVKAVWDADNEDLKIEETQHESATVFPGDKVAWVCDPCPQGAEFTVKDLHHLVDLEEIADFVHKIRKGEEVRLPEEKEDFRLPFQPESEKFVEAGTKISSTPVGEFSGHHLFKFTWVVQKERSNGEYATAELDPHVSGHGFKRP